MSVGDKRVFKTSSSLFADLYRDGQAVQGTELLSTSLLRVELGGPPSRFVREKVTQTSCHLVSPSGDRQEGFNDLGGRELLMSQENKMSKGPAALVSCGPHAPSAP